MLGKYTSHDEYKTFVLGELKVLAETRPDNKEEKVDLPLYLRLLQANRHDSVSNDGNKGNPLLFRSPKINLKNVGKCSSMIKK